MAACVLPTRALNVFACEPEWGALAREIGGNSVKVYTATTALQDPHHIEARPSLIAQMRRADLVVCTGADLETGWLPVLLREAGNAAIQPGRPGYFEAARFVALLEKPATLDRAQGDVHAAGNPHIHTDPRNIARVGAALAARMAEIDPAGAAAYQAQLEGFFDALESSHRPLAGAGRAAEGPAGRGAAQVVHLSAGLAGAEGSRRAGTQARASSPRSATWPDGRAAAGHARPRRAARGLPEPAPGRLAGRNAPASRRWRCPSPWAATHGHSDLFGLFDDTLDQLLQAAP